MVTVVAACLHWLRFRVPITVAAGTCALSGAVLIGIIAFWLHGVLALVAYAIFTVVSLAVDRRALMVSALSFILYLLTQLIAKQSEGESTFATGFAIVGMLIGSGLLVLSAFWHRARKPIVNVLPNSIAAKLPAIQ